MQNLRLNIAQRLRIPLLRLLFLDRRFATAIFILAVLGTTIALAPRRLIRQTPKNFEPEIRVSLVDLVQARMLKKNARKAEGAADRKTADRSWTIAFLNNPADLEALQGHIASLLRGDNARAEERALQLAGFAMLLHTNSIPALETLCLAAEASGAWELILNETRNLATVTPRIEEAVLRARFNLGDFRQARKDVEKTADAETKQVYERALNWVAAKREEDAPARDALRELFGSSGRGREAMRVFLTVAAFRRDLAAFEPALAEYKRTTARTLPIDLLHARLLQDRGLRSRAREVASLVPPPQSSEEAAILAETLLALGLHEDCRAMLEQYCPRFPEGERHWTVFATQLLEENNRAELGKLGTTLETTVLASAPVRALAAAAHAYAFPRPENVVELESRLNAMGRRSPAIRWFASNVLLAIGENQRAVRVLLATEADHLHSTSYYARLFVAAAAVRDDELMRRSAARRFELTPYDLIAMKNHAAMLILFEEQPENAARMTAACLEAEPESDPAKVNHAAALVNAGYIGSADLVLARIDEEKLEASNRDQLVFVKIRRMVRLGNLAGARESAIRLPRAHLFPRQIKWLDNIVESNALAAVEQTLPAELN